MPLLRLHLSVISYFHHLRYSIRIVHDLRPFRLLLLQSFPDNLDVLPLFELQVFHFALPVRLGIGLLEDGLEVLLLGLPLLLYSVLFSLPFVLFLLLVYYVLYALSREGATLFI